MRNTFFLCFMLAIPAMALLGHDLYRTYHDQDFNKTMMFSDIGFLWVTYHPESFAWTRENMDPGTWAVFVTPVLEQTAWMVALLPSAIIFLSALALKLLNLPPFSTVAKSPNVGKFSFGSGDRRQGRFNYKRK